MPDTRELQLLLESVLGSSNSYRNNEVAFFCPFCNHYKKKLQINLVSHAWHCWVCEKRGRGIFNLFLELRVGTDLLEKSKEFRSDSEYVKPREYGETVQLPQEFIPLSGVKIKTNALINAALYLNERGITKTDIIRYNIGYCETGEYANRIVIPSYDSDGELNYFVSRSFFKDEKMKYKNPPVSKNVVGFEFFVNWKLPIVLVEGVFDAIAIRRNAIPLFGKTLPPILSQKISENKVKDIYICLDVDAQSHALKLAEKFMSADANVYLVKLDKKDPSETGFYEMVKTINETGKFDIFELTRIKLYGS